MTNSKTTKRALLSSAVALLVCFSMLLGTTFAWFTDEASTTVNTIQSGTLEVDLVDESGASLHGQIMKFVNANDGTNVLWEPGVTFVSQGFQVVNNGSLALKYKLVINGVDGDAKLLEAIDFWLTTNKDSVEQVNSIKVDLNKEFALAPDGETMTIWGETVGSDSDVYYLVGHMDEAAGNEYQNLTIDGVGITVYATQVEAEWDSFSNDYDAGANYPEPWDGTAGEVPAEDEDGVITITTGAELAAFAADVNGGSSYSGKTVKLGADINLGGQNWTPIGDCESGKYFQGTFDGQGFTISNLYVDKSTDDSEFSTAGLFGWVDAASATLKNLTINGATVKGSHWVGAAAGYWTGEISNVHVTNSTVMGFNVNDDANGDKIGGLVGYMNSGAGKLDGNTVTNTTVSGYRDVAGLAGAVAVDNTVTNNRVEKVTLYYAVDHVGEIVSPKTAVVVDETNTAVNVTINSGKQLVAEGILETAANTYSIISKEGLMNLSGLLPDWTPEIRRTVTLMTDIDMSGETWVPMSDMFVDFNGNGYTISNLTVNGDSDRAGRSGFFAYLGGSTIKNLTLENVTSSGSEAGIFAGQSEGGDIINCKIAGTNTVTWTSDSADKTCKNGIGVFVGVSVESNTTTGEIAEGATVTLNFGGMYDTNNVWGTNDTYVGGLYTEDQSIEVTNNGDIITIENGLGVDSKGNYYVYNAAGLQALKDWMDANSNKGAVWGKTYNIMADIDATNVTWTTKFMVPDSAAFNGFTFDGNGHTISNLTINGQGLFTGTAHGSQSDVPATFKNITFDNVTVTGGTHHNGVIWGEAYGSITLEKVNVINSKVSGGCNVGGLIGRNSESHATFKFIDCAVKNTTVEATKVADYAGASAFLGMALHIEGSTSANVIFEGNNVSEGNTLTTATGMQGGGIYTKAIWDTATWETPTVVSDFTNYNSDN